MTKFFFDYLLSGRDRVIAQALLDYGFVQLDTMSFTPEPEEYDLFQYKGWRFQVDEMNLLSAYSPNMVRFDLWILDWFERADYRSTLLDEELVPKIKKAIDEAMKKADKEWREKHQQLTLF